MIIIKIKNFLFFNLYTKNNERNNLKKLNNNQKFNQLLILIKEKMILISKIFLLFLNFLKKLNKNKNTQLNKFMIKKLRKNKIW